MGEKIPVITEKKYKFDGIFDLKGTYTHLLGYFEDSMFYDISEKDFAETKLAGKKDIMSKVEGEKLYNDFFKIFIKLEIVMKGTDVEVETNNKIQVLTRGTAQLSLNAYLEPDWSARRDRTPLLDFLGKVYDKFVGNDEQTTCENEAAKDVGMLIARFKEHMNATIK